MSAHLGHTLRHGLALAAVLLAAAPTRATPPEAFDLQTPRGRSAARAALLTHRPQLRPAQRRKAEAELVFDLNQITVTLDFDGDDLPRRGQYTVALQAREATDALPLYFPFADVSTVSEGGIQLPFEAGGDGVLTVLRPLAAGERATFQITARLGFACVDAIACITEPPLVHVVDTGWYPINALQPLDDAFELAVAYRGAPWPVAASGAREAIERDDMGVQTWRYRTERDAVLAAFAVGSFRRIGYTPLVEVFAPDNGFDDGRALAEVSQSVADAYTAYFGFYPFSRLGLAPISDEAGVALGPQANILLPESFFQAAPFNTDAWTLVSQVVAHEIGHQYFFNTVRVAADDEAWLSESFAEYASLRFGATTDGGETQFLENYWGYVLNVGPDTDTPVRSQAVRSSPSYFEIIYQKGSAALIQLRRRYGGLAFDAALRTYVAEFTDRVADTDDLKRILSAQLGGDLLSYFAQWIERPGFPTLTIKVSPARTERSGYALTVTQTSPTGPFSDPLPALLVLPEGSVAPALFGLSGEFSGPESPQRIVIDPDLTVFRRVITDPPGDVNLSGVVDGLDLLDVTAALGQLAGEPGYVETADVNGDGAVNQADLDAVIANFGQGW